MRSGAILRGLLDGHSAGVWTVGREIELVESYVVFNAAREQETSLRIDIPHTVRGEMIAACALQSAIFAGKDGDARTVVIRLDGDALEMSIASAGGASTSVRVPFERQEPVRKDAIATPPARRFSPGATFATILAFILIVGVVVQLAERSEITSWYIPWAALRTGLSLTLPLVLSIPLHRRGHPNPILLVLVAVAGAIVGELSFFAILAAINAPGVPAVFSVPSVAIALDSVALGSVLNLSFLLFTECLLVLREELRYDDRRIDLEQELSRAHLELLQSQIRPHFLFNALNSLLALITTDSAASLKMLALLRSFYSKAATADRSVTMTIAEEVALVSEYLDIERVRFGERLTTVLDVAPETLQWRVPSLLLQPLVENAIKHGIARHAGAGWIRVRIRHDENQIEIEIRNSGTTLASSRSSTGIGLANTRKRLSASYGRNASLRTTIDTTGLNVVRILLPAS